MHVVPRCLQDAFTACYDAMIIRNTRFPYPFVIIMKLLVCITIMMIPLAIHVIPLTEHDKNEQARQLPWKIYVQCPRLKM